MKKRILRKEIYNIILYNKFIIYNIDINTYHYISLILLQHISKIFLSRIA